MPIPYLWLQNYWKNSKEHDDSLNWMYLGIYNVRIKDGDQWKAAFKTNRGLFEPTVMFFWIMQFTSHIPSYDGTIYWNMINECIILCIWRHFPFVTGWNTLAENTKKVLARLRDNDCSKNPPNGEFTKRKLIFRDGYRGRQNLYGPWKATGIREWPSPATVKQVRGFLGFWKLLSTIHSTLFKVVRTFKLSLKKGSEIWMDRRLSKRIDDLKKRSLKNHIMSQTRHDPFKLKLTHQNMQQEQFSLIWTQMATDTWFHLSLKPSHQRTTMKTMIRTAGIIRALEDGDIIFKDLHTPPVYYTDHKNLTYYREAMKLNRRQARWSLYCLNSM